MQWLVSCVSLVFSQIAEEHSKSLSWQGPVPIRMGSTASCLKEIPSSPLTGLKAEADSAHVLVPVFSSRHQLSLIHPSTTIGSREYVQHPHHRSSCRSLFALYDSWTFGNWFGLIFDFFFVQCWFSLNKNLFMFLSSGVKNL